MSDQERRDKLERLAHVRQQKNNFFISESAKKLKNRKSDLPKAERKAITERLTKQRSHLPPRPKSPTNVAHMVLATGGASSLASASSPASPDSRADSPVLASPGSPKSRGGGGGHEVSPPGTIVKSKTRTSSKSEGLTVKEFYRADWKPSFTYRPAKQDKPWENVEGFAKSTRTLERRKMDPYLDINSFTGNGVSAKATFSDAHVRPLDVKGNLGAAPVQKWKETLREDFARDEDNQSSNAHDANLDELRALLATTSILTDLE